MVQSRMKNFENVLTHELTHIIFREYVGFGWNVPLWLDEGVAMFMEKKKSVSMMKRELQKIKQANMIFNFKELTEISKQYHFLRIRQKRFISKALILFIFLYMNSVRINSLNSVTSYDKEKLWRRVCGLRIILGT